MKSHSADADQSDMPLVSVVITTRNEEKNIRNCLESVKCQSYPRIEIIVVDNNSTDSTQQLAAEYTPHVYNKGPERSTQRNFGMINVAKGKYVMFVDADMILSHGLIQEALNKIESDRSLVGLYIPLRWVGSNWIIKSKGFEREFYDATCLDAVRFIKRNVILKIDGFDDRLYGGEDWDLDRRIRGIGEVDIIDSVMYHYEDEDITLRKYLKKMLYYSKNMDIYIEKWGKADSEIKNQFGLWYRYFVVFIEKGKWKKILRYPSLAIGMYWLKFLVGFVFLFRNLFSSDPCSIKSL